MTTSSIVVAVLGVGGMSAILGAIITGLFSKRKMGADATEALQRAASGLVADLRKQIDNERTDHHREVDDLTRKLERLVAEWRTERESWRRVNQLHVSFDLLAIAKLSEAGIDLGMDPPPLLPPTRADFEDM